jgi:hypothetical protein
MHNPLLLVKQRSFTRRGFFSQTTFPRVTGGGVFAMVTLGVGWGIGINEGIARPNGVGEVVTHHFGKLVVDRRFEFLLGQHGDFYLAVKRGGHGLPGLPERQGQQPGRFRP